MLEIIYDNLILIYINKPNIICIILILKLKQNDVQDFCIQKQYLI